MQVGYVGLLKAIGNFDPAICASLAAYARPCVSGELKRHFRDKRWQVHVKRSVKDLMLEAREATWQLALQPSSLDSPLAGQPGTGTLAAATAADHAATGQPPTGTQRGVREWERGHLRGQEEALTRDNVTPKVDAVYLVAHQRLT